MKSFDKIPWLASLEMQTEESIRDAVRIFQNMNEDALKRPSLTGGWSIAQCLAHLNSYGQYYLPRLQEVLEKGAQSGIYQTYTSSWIGRYLIRITDPESGQRKLKAVKRHQPADTLPAFRIVAEFIEQQEDMLRLLRLAQKANVNHGRIPLSITSWVRLPPGDILHFMVVHTNRHMKQAKRNVQEVS